MIAFDEQVTQSEIEMEVKARNNLIIARVHRVFASEMVPVSIQSDLRTNLIQNPVYELDRCNYD